MISRADARRHLEALASEPRPAGSEAEGRAREYCARELAALGMHIAQEPFAFSAFPGRYATPVIGVVAIIALGAAALFARAGQARGAVAILVATLLTIALAGAWMARHGVVRLGLLRQESVNLIARRGHPVVWLVAHLDSKSQPVPMLLRAGGITVFALVWVAALGVAIAQAVGALDAEAAAPWWGWIPAAGLLAGAPIAASFVGTRSPGAVDDASGVATVLLAAEAAHDLPIGVLLTSAEELGLAGARAWVRSRAPGTAINCDGVDDAGVLAAMYSGRAPTRLLAAFARAAQAEGARARGHRVLPGILVDGVALADAGWDVLTISKGTVGTLRRIHTSADDLRSLSGEGVAEAARVLHRMTRELVEGA